MAYPYFSIVLATKNRSSVVSYALESVLRQTFTDFEIILQDNDDTDDTSKVIERYDDPRIRYFRTNGKLSMVDNWESGVSHAEGQYLICLTDRSALKSFALEKIRNAIDLYREDAFVWQFDMFDDRTGVVSYLNLPDKPEVKTSTELFSLFLNNGYNAYSNYLPRGLNSCCARSVVDDIRRSTGGVLFHRMSPDYTFAFMVLAHRSRVVEMNTPLFVWGYPQLSNGGGVYGESETLQRFIQDLSSDESSFYGTVPIKALGIHNSLFNDLIRLKQQFPDLFREVEPDWAKYFVACREEIEERSLDDGSRQARMAAWESALAQQPPTVRQKVKDLIQPTAQKSLRFSRRVRYSASSVVTQVRRVLRDSEMPGVIKRDTSNRFGNITEAVVWLENQELAEMGLRH
jgi:glycosyltransferase involved in cell wall biosynthesis